MRRCVPVIHIHISRPGVILSKVLGLSGKPIRYVAQKIVDNVITALVVIGVTAGVAFLGWKVAPPEFKQTIKVLVDVNTDELIQTLKDIQEWAAIEVERARNE